MRFNKKIFIYVLSFLFFLVVIYYLIIISLSSNHPIIKRREVNFKTLYGSFKSTFEKELITAGIPQSERQAIIRAFGKSIDFRTLGEKDDYTLTLTTTGAFISIDIDRGNRIYSVFKSSDGYAFEQRDVLINIDTFSVNGNINEILWNSMSDVNIPADVILNYTDMFAWDIDFLTEVRTGDKFGVVYQVRKNAKGKVLSRKVLCGYYDGSVTGKKFSLYYKDDYYNENGESARSFFLKAPLQYRRISSYFTYKRYHPILKYIRPHLGIDYAAPTGTPVSSVADGVVVYKGWKGGYGNYIEIKHAMGYTTSYGHLSKFSSRIFVGKRVKQGEVIGYVGMTGIASGPHLDFRIKQNDRYLNYLKLKRSSYKKLSQSDIIEIRKKISEFFPRYINF